MSTPATEVERLRRGRPASMLIDVPAGKDLARACVAVLHPARRVMTTTFNLKRSGDPAAEREVLLRGVSQATSALPDEVPLNVLLGDVAGQDPKALRRHVAGRVGRREVGFRLPTRDADTLRLVANYARRTSQFEDLSHDGHVYLHAITDGSTVFGATVMVVGRRVDWRDWQRPHSDLLAAVLEALLGVIGHATEGERLLACVSHAQVGGMLRHDKIKLDEHHTRMAVEVRDARQAKRVELRGFEGDAHLRRLARRLVTQAHEGVSG